MPTRQALCLLYTEGLSDESRTNFHDLMSNGHRDAADTQKCHEIAAAGAPSQSVCTDAEDEGLEACHDDAAQEGGVRFDLVLLPQGDRTAILGWASTFPSRFAHAKMCPLETTSLTLISLTYLRRAIDVRAPQTRHNLSHLP